MKSIDVLKDAAIEDVVNAMLENGHLIRLSSNKLNYLCGSATKGFFASLARDYVPPKIKLSVDMRKRIDRGYTLNTTPFLLLTNREKDCFVWVRYEKATLEKQGGYKEVGILEILDESPIELIEDLIFNLDLMT